jgi:hypothetical protein
MHGHDAPRQQLRLRPGNYYARAARVIDARVIVLGGHMVPAAMSRTVPSNREGKSWIDATSRHPQIRRVSKTLPSGLVRRSAVSILDPAAATHPLGEPLRGCILQRAHEARQQRGRDRADEACRS